MYKKLLLFFMISAVLFSMTACANHPDIEHAKEQKQGYLRIESTPQGADIYINSERYEKAVAPCTIPLDENVYEIELVIPGYEKCVNTVNVTAGVVTEITCSILPEIPYEDTIKTVTVSNEADTDPSEFSDITVDDLSSLTSVSFRQALTAIQNDESDCWYRVEFAENVERIELVGNNIEFTRDNLVINGDKNRDGVPDVSVTSTEWGTFFYSINNLHIMGLKLDGDVKNGGCAFVVRPFDHFCEDISVSNVYLLGCEIRNIDVIPFGGGCKEYNSCGKVDYANINACGNNIYQSDLFFAYSGNIDNSTTDGLFYCANTLDSESCITTQNSDCNTNYIYGPGTESANGGTPGAFETSDGNIVKNVLVSGNHGGRFVCSSSVGGSSGCISSNILIRNNVFTNYAFIRVTQPMDEKNEGLHIVMNNNVIEELTFEYNVLVEYPLYMSLAAFDIIDSTSKFTVNNNIMRNITIKDNYVVGNDYSKADNVSDKIDVELNDGIIPGEIEIGIDYISNQYLPNVEFSNNRYENLLFENNHSIKEWKPGEAWDSMEIVE